jgi:archaellum component FlaC
LVDYQKVLIQQKKIFRSGMPIKMNTLEDKRKKVINFSSCLDKYNTWTESSNEFSKIRIDEISERISKENKIYELVD